MTLYYIETDFGCGIREARHLRQAKSDMRREAGEFVKVVRRATKDDLEWIEAMGGYIPKKVKKDD